MRLNRIVLSFAASLALLVGCTGGPDAPASSTNQTAPAEAVDAGPPATGESDPGAPTSDAGSAGPGTGTGASANGALAIVKLSATVSTVTWNPRPTESSSVTFVAIVTATAGLDTIAGGALEDDTGALYGAFGAGSTKGTFVAMTDFAAMNRIRAIDFSNAGGTRGNACAADAICAQGTCKANRFCLAGGDVCDQVCAAQGLVCGSVARTDGPACTGVVYLGEGHPCNAPAPVLPGGIWQCRCR